MRTPRLDSVFASEQDLRMATGVVGGFVPPLQQSIDRYLSALGTPARLLALAPKAVGNPGNAAALSSAIVLTTVSAFEGFAEETLATLMALRGQGFAQIAGKVGNWNNPPLKDWVDKVTPYLSVTAQATVKAGPAAKIRTYRMTPANHWSVAGRPWKDVLEESEAWMQARHLLTHGLTTGWGAEYWPPPKGNKPQPHANTVLRAKAGGKHSLERRAAKSCARIYVLGAQFVSDVIAGDVGQTLDWTGVPDFS